MVSFSEGCLTKVVNSAGIATGIGFEATAVAGGDGDSGGGGETVTHSRIWTGHESGQV